jgi:hypothetical protein
MTRAIFLSLPRRPRWKMGKNNNKNASLDKLEQALDSLNREK